MAAQYPGTDVLGLRGPNQVYHDVGQYNSPVVKLFSLGNKYLIGHWKSVRPNDVDLDWDQQTQNITQFIHFGTGLGWVKLKNLTPSLLAVLDAAYPDVQLGIEYQGSVLSCYPKVATRKISSPACDRNCIL